MAKLEDFELPLFVEVDGDMHQIGVLTVPVEAVYDGSNVTQVVVGDAGG